MRKDKWHDLAVRAVTAAMEERAVSDTRSARVMELMEVAPNGLTTPLNYDGTRDPRSWRRIGE